MTEQTIEAVDNDEDDVVIIGDVMPKPMTSHNKEKPRRRVEFKKSKYKKESLVITQKIKMKKQKYKCILKETKVNNTQSTQDSVKKDNKCENGSSELTVKCERYAPVCLRKTCRDRRCKVQFRSERTTKKVKTNRRHHCDFPRDLKRMLSPVSPSPLERDLSFDLDISFDTSSLLEVNESYLDTLIKRTRDRDRKTQMTRTQYLFTPPHTNVPDEGIPEDIQISETAEKPPYTSTPKYEENDNKSSDVTINNIMEQSKAGKSPCLEDIPLIFSPIKKTDDDPNQQSVQCKDQGSQCFSSLLTDTNTQDSKSESVNTAFKTNFDFDIVDNSVNFSNDIKEQVSKGNMLVLIVNKKSEHVQTDESNIKNEQNIFSNKTCNCNIKQLIIGQHPLLTDKKIKFKTNECIKNVVSNNKSIADRMSISNNNDKNQEKKAFSPSLENTKIVQKQTESTQTHNSNTNYEQNEADMRILDSNSIVKPLNNSSCSEQLHIQQQNSDIQNIVTNTNGLLIDDGKILNYANVTSNDNALLKDAQSKKSEYIQTVSHVGNKDLRDNNALATTKHTSSWGDLKVQQKQLPHVQTTISGINNDNDEMSVSFSNKNINEQACAPNSLFNYNVQNRNDVHTNIINSNPNLEQNNDEIDMSISYDDDNIVDQPFNYEYAHLQHIQSEYYLHTAVANTNFGNMNYFNGAENFHTNYKQIADSKMSVSDNNFKEQYNTFRDLFPDDEHLRLENNVVSHNHYERNNTFSQQSWSDFNPLDKDIHAQDIKYDSYYDINSNDQTNYDREKSIFYKKYSERRNIGHGPFVKDPNKQFVIHSDSPNIKEENSIFKKIFKPNENNSKDQHNRLFLKDMNRQHEKSDNHFTDYSNNKYERYNKYECRNGATETVFYNNNFKNLQNIRRGPYFENTQDNNIHYNDFDQFNGEHEQIRNMSISHDNSNSNTNNKRSQSHFSKNFYERKGKTDFIGTSYSYKHSEKIDHNKKVKEKGMHRSAFYNETHSQPKKDNVTPPDDSKNTYKRKFDDNEVSISYNNDNFRENPPKRQNNSYDSSQHKKSKFMHTHDSYKHSELRFEERKVSTKKKTSYFEDKRNKAHTRVEDRHKFVQERKSAYNAVLKNKVDIFIDKRMSDEAYEDVLVGLPPGQISP